MKYIKKVINLVYVLVFAFLAIAVSVYFRSRLLFLTGCCVLLLTVSDVILFEFFAGHIGFEMKTDRLRLKKGDSFKIRFMIKNFTPVILSYVKINFDIKNFYYSKRNEEITAATGIFSKEKIEIPVKCTLNGNVSVRVNSVIAGDLLGLMSREIVCNDVCTVAVVPVCDNESIDLPQAGVTGEELHTEETKSYSGDVTGIREYITGDKLNNIHWKLTVAKGNEELLVKEFAESLNDTVVVVFEYYKENVDAITDSLFAVAYSLIKNNTTFKLMWVNGGCEDAVIKNITSEQDFIDFSSELYTSYPCDVPTAAIDSFTMTTGTKNCIYIDNDGIVK